MSIELLHADSDTELFDDWLEQSVLDSEVPLVLDHPETVSRVALMLSPTEPADQAA